jgi:hypothetical protein
LALTPAAKVRIILFTPAGSRRGARVAASKNQLCRHSEIQEVSMRTPSYVSGTSSHPLIGETIGNCFERSAAKWSEREALVVRQQNVRYT